MTVDGPIRRVVIAGATGYLGRHLVQEFASLYEDLARAHPP